MGRRDEPLTIAGLAVQNQLALRREAVFQQAQLLLKFMTGRLPTVSLIDNGPTGSPLGAVAGVSR
jgi:hypothetical protein